MAQTLNQLSVREHGVKKGGEVVAAYDTSGRSTIDGQGRVLLLVHGYNNSVDAALASFITFVQSLEQIAGRPSLPWAVYGVHWPGDESNSVMSLLSYGAKIGVARTSAASLFDYLKVRHGPEGAPMSISIVAHSLGTRLTLELADQLRALAGSAEPANVVLERLVLMAAAVPEFRAERGGTLRAAVEYARGVCVLHSTGDRVLQYAFPPGQTSGGDGFFPTAVGRYGHPSDAWRQGMPMADMSGSRPKKYGHGSYWGGRESAAAAAAFLGLPVPVAPAARALEEHDLPEPYEIAARALEARASFF